jgi:hypothetical protein
LSLAQDILENPKNWKEIVKTKINNPFKTISFDNLLNHKVTHLSAYLQAKRDGFGGRERSIHYCPDVYNSTLFGTVDDEGHLKSTPLKTEIFSKRVVKTGTYYPPRHPRYYDDDEYKPGGLTDIKTHVIVTTHYGDFHTDDIRHYKSKGNI